MEIPNPGSSPSFPPADNIQDTLVGSRSNLLRTLRLRWTAGDDQLIFNTRQASASKGNEEDRSSFGNNVESGVKVLPRRSAVLDTLNAFLASAPNDWSPDSVNNLIFFSL